MTEYRKDSASLSSEDEASSLAEGDMCDSSIGNHSHLLAEKEGRLEPSGASPKETRKTSFDAWSKLLIENELVDRMGQTSGTLGLSEDVVFRDVESYSVEGQQRGGQREATSRGRAAKKSPYYNRSRPRMVPERRLEKRYQHVIVLPKFRDRADESLETFVTRLAKCLREREVSTLREIVNILGRAAAVRLYEATAKIEKEGGMMTKDNSRKRLSGGIFMHLATEDCEGGEKVKEYFKKVRLEKRSFKRKLSAANSNDSAKRAKVHVSEPADSCNTNPAN